MKIPLLFKCIENIDFSLFVLSYIYENESNKKSLSPIEIMIDNATGYTFDQNKKTIENVIWHLKRIVRYKNMSNKECGTTFSTEKERKSILQLKKINFL